MKRFACLYYFILLFSPTLLAQELIVCWPHERRGQVAQKLQYRPIFFQMMEFGPPPPRYRPIYGDEAFEFYTYLSPDTTHFLSGLPRQFMSSTAFVLEQVGRWSRAEMEKRFVPKYGKRWHRRKYFIPVMQELLGESFRPREDASQDKENKNQYQYKDSALCVLWDHYDKEGYHEIGYYYNSIGQSDILRDYYYEYSLDDVQWVLLGREPLHRNYVLLLLTKKLRRLPSTDPVEP